MIATRTTQRKRFKNSVLVHDSTAPNPEQVVYGDRIDATLRLEDGRQVQVGILNNGHVTIRAWAADPYATNNGDACALSFTLPTLEDMVLDSAQVSNVNMRTSVLSERSLADPDQHDGTWYYATDAIRDRVTALRLLLGLGSTPTKDN